MVKLVVSVLAAVVVSQAFAVRTNKLVNGASKWNETGSYELPFVPGEGDVVVVQATSTN